VPQVDGGAGGEGGAGGGGTGGSIAGGCSCRTSSSDSLDEGYGAIGAAYGALAAALGLGALARRRKRAA